MKKLLTDAQEAIRQQFQAHIDAEMRGDLDTTLSTMTSNPHLNHIPTLIGGIGQEAVRSSCVAISQGNARVYLFQFS